MAATSVADELTSIRELIDWLVHERRKRGRFTADEQAAFDALLEREAALLQAT